MDTTMQTRNVYWSGKVTTSKRLVQAYRQAPWRIATQRGLLLLIVAVLGASVLWVLVSISVQAAEAGLDIQTLEGKQEELQRQIAGLKTEYAVQTSSAKMANRAEALGFKPVTPEDITYMIIPGYRGREPDIQASPPRSVVEQSLVKPAYTQSLWEWLLQGFIDFNQQPGDSSP